MRTIAKNLVASTALILVIYTATANAATDIGGSGTQTPSIAGAPNQPIVAAFYYPWYGNPANDGQWINWPQNSHTPPQDIASDYYPQLGAYSARDEAVLSQHMEWLQQAHVELIIVSWWGQGSKTDQAIPGILAQATSHGIQVAFHMEPYAGRSASKLVDDVAYIYAHYGNSPSFFRSTEMSRHSQDNKAKGLFFLYLANYAYDGGIEVDATYWQSAIDQIHAASDGGLIIGDKDVASWIDAGHFDGEYAYTSIHPWPDGWEQNMLYWANGLPVDAWFIPSVLPGFSASRVSYPPSTYRSRDGGRTYDRQWQMVTQTGVTPKIIAITSFNEWHEGSQIEPAATGISSGQGYTYTSYELGPYQYISATAAYVAMLPQSVISSSANTVSVTLTGVNINNGLYQHDLQDGLTESVLIGGRYARHAISNTVSQARYLYLWVNNDFHYGASAGMVVSVQYFDASGSFRLEYDSNDPGWPGNAAYKRTSDIALTGTNQWHIANFFLPDAFFGNRQNVGADMRIRGTGDYYISDISVSKVDLSAHAFLPVLIKNP